MRFVHVLIAAAAAAAVFVSSVAAEGPTDAATQVANAPPAAQEQQSGHHASDAALSAAVDAATPEEVEQAAPLEPPPPTLFADIDLSTQTVTVSDASGELYRWSISSARAGYRTPTGTFTVNWTSRMHYSRQYDWSPMPYAVFFNRGVAVHGTAAVGSLGRPASHGCVRLRTRNAKTFYNLVHKHGQRQTQIAVRGTPPYSPYVAEGRRYRPQPVFQPFSFFAYDTPAYQPRRRRARRTTSRGGYYGAW